MNPSSFQLKFQRSSFFSSRVGTTDVLNLKAVFSGKKQILKWANIELNSFDSFVAPGQRPWTFRTSHPKNQTTPEGPEDPENRVFIVSFEVFIVTVWSHFTSGCWTGALRHRWLSKNSSPGISGLSFVFLVVDS